MLELRWYAVEVEDDPFLPNNAKVLMQIYMSLQELRVQIHYQISRLLLAHYIGKRLKEEIAEAETRNAELTRELHSVRGQLAAEQSRCFKHEADVAELRQKLENMGALEKVELLR